MFNFSEFGVRDFSDFEKLSQICMGVTSVLLSTNKLNIYEKIEAAPIHISELAKKCDLNNESMSLLVEALISIGLLHFNRGKLETTLIFKKIKSENSQMPFNNFRKLWTYWEDLPGKLNAKQPIVSFTNSNGTNKYTKNLSTQFNKSLVCGEVFAQLINSNGSKIERVLDVGAGSGIWSISLQKLNKNIDFTLIDKELVIKKMRKEIVDNFGEKRKLNFITGDFFEKPWTTGLTYNLVIMGNISHLYNEDQNKILFNKALSVLDVSNGKLAIIDVLKKNNSIENSLYSLDLGLRTETGRLYSKEEYYSRLIELGFSNVEFYPLPRTTEEVSLIIASIH